MYRMMSRIDACGSASRVHVSKMSGSMEVLKLEDDDSFKQATFRKTYSCDKQELTNKPINLHNGKLHVLGPTENVFIHSAESATRPGSSAGRQGSAGKKCYASAKQISLRTVKSIASSSNVPDYNVADLKDSKKIDPDPVLKEPVPSNTAKIESAGVHMVSVYNASITEQLQQQSSSDEDESDDEKTVAPIELLTEFIKAVMDEDYKLAWKLCQMILIYEPENPEAKEFSPLIQNMLQNEEDYVSEEDDSDEDTDEDDDSSDTDNSESNSTDNSEASSEDEADNK